MCACSAAVGRPPRVVAGHLPQCLKWRCSSGTSFSRRSTDQSTERQDAIREEERAKTDKRDDMRPFPHKLAFFLSIIPSSPSISDAPRANTDEHADPIQQHKHWTPRQENLICQTIASLITSLFYPQPHFPHPRHKARPGFQIWASLATTTEKKSRLHCLHTSRGKPIQKMFFSASDN